MDPVEVTKLKPAQLTLLFALALPLAAVPTLYIFLAAPQLFDALETSKLMLLAFSSSAPIFGVFFAVTLMRYGIEKRKGSAGSDVVADSVHIASAVTSLVYALFAFDLFVNAHPGINPERRVLVLPVFFCIAAGYVLLLMVALKNRRRVSRPNQAPEPTTMAQL